MLLIIAGHACSDYFGWGKKMLITFVVCMCIFIIYILGRLYIGVNS